MQPRPLQRQYVGNRLFQSEIRIQINKDEERNGDQSLRNFSVDNGDCCPILSDLSGQGVEIKFLSVRRHGDMAGSRQRNNAHGDRFPNCGRSFEATRRAVHF